LKNTERTVYCEKTESVVSCGVGCGDELLRGSGATRCVGFFTQRNPGLVFPILQGYRAFFHFYSNYCTLPTNGEISFLKVPGVWKTVRNPKNGNSSRRQEVVVLYVR